MARASFLLYSVDLNSETQQNFSYLLTPLPSTFVHSLTLFVSHFAVVHLRCLKRHMPSREYQIEKVSVP